MMDDLQPIWVDTAEGVGAAALAARSAGWLALDTEADSLHSYFHKTCLVQLTASGANFIIDPLAMTTADLDPLWRVVEDPGIPTLMHGSDYDIRVLDRDYDVRIRGLVDTQIMAQMLGEPKTGLSALLEKELGLALDKKHQRADWGRRPLTASQIVYAAADTAYLQDLARRLRRRLEKLGRYGWAVEEFRRLEQVRHRPAEPNPLAFERVKGVRALRGRARDRAFSLFEWRERQAQELDMPPFKVLGNKPLVEMAENPPKDKARLAKVDGLGHRFVRRWGDQVLGVVKRPDPSPPWKKMPRQSEPGAEVVKRQKRLAAVRDRLASELGIEAGLLCAKSCLLAVASHQPKCTSRADLETAGLAGWRLEVLEPGFLEALGGR
jgi:ribonuclease D